MSKRLSILLVIFGLTAIGGGFFISKVIKQSAHIPEIVSDSPIGDTFMPTSTPVVKKPSTPKYKGQALSYLGSSEILSKYPKEAVAWMEKIVSRAERDESVTAL